MEIENKISNKWTLWFHHINDENWGEDSYTKIKDVVDIRDYYEITKYIENVNAGMFFFMKDNIFPRWEDINNMEGGYWSFRILKTDTHKIWNDLLAYSIGNTLTKQVENMDEITGISISPKINNSIIKIWNRDANKCEIDIFDENVKNMLGEAFYKKH